MNRTHLLGVALLLVLALASASAWGQEPYKAGRTAWGDPDLTGMWPVDQVGQTPRQRP